MKRILSAMVMVFTLICCFNSVLAAEEKKSGLLDAIIETAISPVETILGPIADLGKIIVGPTKTKERLSAASSSVSVIDVQDAVKVGERRVEEALRDVLGTDVVESGTSGPTSVFLRGANSNHTLVLLDGIKLYDPMSPNAALDFTDLSLDNLEQIEVVRGTQSALYGSDAIGGVVNLETKKAMDNFFNVIFDAGSFYTTHEVFEMGAYVDRLHYTIGASQFNTKGISQASAKKDNQERDPYDRTSFSARIDYDLTDNFTVGGTFRGALSHSKYDSFGTDDPGLCYRHESHIFTQYIEQILFDWWKYKINMGWMINLRRDYDDPDGSTYSNYLRDYYLGKYFKIDYQNTFNILDMNNIVVGYDYTEEFGSSYKESYGAVSVMPKTRARNGSFYLENRFNFKDRLTATQGMRVDHHSYAGTHVTYKFDGSYLFPSATKLRGCIATGFKAPTLYELNAPSSAGSWGMFAFGGGNPTLKPETSLSYEYGLDQFLCGEKIMMSVVYFQTRFKNLISTTTDAMWNTSQYQNINKAYSYGIESEIRFKPSGVISGEMSYTWMKTKDFSTDSELLRRAKHKFKAKINWLVFPGFETDFIIRYIGPRLNYGTDKLKQYATVDVTFNYKLSKNFTAFVNIQNLLDEQYEEVRGNGEPGIAAYGGIRVLM